MRSGPDDALGVGGLERVAQLLADGQRPPDRQPPVAAELGGQGPPAQQLHHQVEDAVLGLTEVDDLDHARLVEPAGEPGLAQEALGGLAIVGQLGVHDLDRDLAIDRQLDRAVDRAHAALAQRLADLEAPVEDAADQRVVVGREPDQAGAVVGAALELGRERAAAGRAVRLGGGVAGAGAAGGSGRRGHDRGSKPGAAMTKPSPASADGR